MKKLFTLLLVLVCCVGTASATDYYVVGDPAGGWSYTPVKDNKALKMTESSTTAGLYYYDYTTSETTIKYFAIANGDGSGSDWTDFNTYHRWGNPAYAINGDVYGIAMTHGNNTLNFTPDGTSTYRIVFDSNNEKLSFVKHVTYVVAGSYNSEASFFTTKDDINSDVNELILQDDGSYAKTYENIPLTTASTMYYKIVKKGDDGTGMSSYNNYVVNTAYTYDIKFQVWTNNFGGAVCTLSESAVTDYYVVGGLNDGSDWVVSATPMTLSEGVYSTEFVSPSTSSYNYRFAIAPNTVIKDGNVFNWGYLRRPYQGSSSDKDLAFEVISNYSVTTSEAEGNAWNVPSSLTGCNIKFTFDADNNKYSSLPYFTRTPTATSEGYMTYSYGSNAALPDGVTAYFATGLSEGSVTLSSKSGSLKANVGYMLQGTAGTEYKFYATGVAPTVSDGEVSANLLKASVTATDITTEMLASKYYYFFSSQPSVAFYRLDAPATSAAGKAYLETSETIGSTAAGAKLTFIIDDSETTSIKDAKAVSYDENAPMYNLAGQRVAKDFKGVVIQGGKKFIVK